MIPSINSLSTSSIVMLPGASGSSPTDPASVASRLLGDVTGNTDDVFKAGNAIGNIIEIAARMKQDAVPAAQRVKVEEIDVRGGNGRTLNRFDGNNLLYEVNGTLTTSFHGNGEHTERFVGTFQGMTDEAQRQFLIDGLKADQSTPRNRAALAAFENGTMQEVDIADLGFVTSVARTTHYYSDGRAADRIEFDLTASKAFLEQHTEMRDGVMYDKETGEFAALGQNGTKRVYYTW